MGGTRDDGQLGPSLRAPVSWSCSKQRTEWGLDEHGGVELLDVGRDAEGRHRLELAERVAPLQEIVRVALVEGPGDEQDDLRSRKQVSYLPSGTRPTRRTLSIM